MFLFSKKHKTPISTYTDSYRPPCSFRNTFKEKASMLPPKENFVTQGLWVPPVRSPASQGQCEQLTKEEMQRYYRNTMDPAAYRPEKYWLARSQVTNLLSLYTVSGRQPLQGYYSPCSGRHYCLQGMDYYADGLSALRRHLHTPEERTEYFSLSQPQEEVLYNNTSPLSVCPVSTNIS